MIKILKIKKKNEEENLIKFEKCSRMPRRAPKQIKKVQKVIQSPCAEDAPKCSAECWSRPKKVLQRFAPAPLIGFGLRSGSTGLIITILDRKSEVDRDDE